MNDGSCRAISACRVCRGRDLEAVLSLGATPLANAFVEPSELGRPEPRYPLEVLRCPRCGMVQLSVVVPPEIMFAHYRYASSASAPMVAHFDQLAETLIGAYAPPGTLVVEVGSNDGVLLRPFAALGVRVVGVEPATNLARSANAAGLETWNEFFDTAIARRIVSAKGPAALVVGNNVLAHIDDLNDLVAALDALLGPDGVFVAEVPYLGDLMANVEYDTIYHEHLSYFAIAPLVALFAQAGLQLFDVERLAIHGGSIRIRAGRVGRHPRTARLAEAEAAELAAGLRHGSSYQRFAADVEASRAALRGMLGELRRSGKSVAAFGASAKGNTLLNYCEIGTDLVTFIADSTPLKHGLLTPGMHIPVRPEVALLEDRPDYALLLAWNYADAILRTQASYVTRGGRFIHPIPVARVLPA